MTLLKNVASIKSGKKDTHIRFRCSENFKKLVDLWVKKTTSTGYSQFIRTLVMVASSENQRRDTKLINTLKKEIDSDEY